MVNSNVIFLDLIVRSHHPVEVREVHEAIRQVESLIGHQVDLLIAARHQVIREALIHDLPVFLVEPVVHPFSTDDALQGMIEFTKLELIEV